MLISRNWGGRGKVQNLEEYGVFHSIKVSNLQLLGRGAITVALRI